MKPEDLTDEMIREHLILDPNIQEDRALGMEIRVWRQWNPGAR